MNSAASIITLRKSIISLPKVLLSSKIHQLISILGIESNNINGVYDFSSIGKIEDHPEEVDKGILLMDSLNFIILV